MAEPTSQQTLRRTPVLVHATDPISEAGVTSALRYRHEVRVVEDGTTPADPDLVCLVLCDRVDEHTLGSLRRLARNGQRRLVLVVTHVDDGGLLAAIEAGVSGLLRRADAGTEALVRAVRRAAQGDGTMPPDLLGRLLQHVGQLQQQTLAPRGISLNGLTERETEVLRLVAEGYDTAEIARTLRYSERTVKNILHDVTTRLQLRNRSHAVAYALRAGII